MGWRDCERERDSKQKRKKLFTNGISFNLNFSLNAMATWTKTAKKKNFEWIKIIINWTNDKGNSISFILFQIKMNIFGTAKMMNWTWTTYMQTIRIVLFLYSSFISFIIKNEKKKNVKVEWPKTDRILQRKT